MAPIQCLQETIGQIVLFPIGLQLFDPMRRLVGCSVEEEATLALENAGLLVLGPDARADAKVLTHTTRIDDLGGGGGAHCSVGDRLDDTQARRHLILNQNVTIHFKKFAIGFDE